MLKNIPPILSPELMKTMLEMGHGDEIVIADGNFPSNSQGVPVIRLDGHNVNDVLEAMLIFFPLDTYTDKPVVLMEVVKGDSIKPVVWDTYYEILKKNQYEKSCVEHIDRFLFYERSKKVYAIIATSDKALYANILIKKGTV